MGVTALSAAIAADRPFDWASLGEVVGTAIVPALADDAPSWSPPKEFQVDVTRHLRSLTLGEATFHGWALRVVPDRGVDDAWTVRIHLPETPAVRLEIDLFAD